MSPVRIVFEVCAIPTAQRTKVVLAPGKQQKGRWTEESRQLSYWLRERVKVLLMVTFRVPVIVLVISFGEAT